MLLINPPYRCLYAFLVLSQGVLFDGYCGSLSVNAPHKLIGSSIIEGVALLEEMCHWELA